MAIHKTVALSAVAAGIMLSLGPHRRRRCSAPLKQPP